MTTRKKLPNRRPSHTETLQVGVPGEALARSVGRLPAGPVTPVELDHAPGRKVPASPIGAALDLITAFENEAAE